MCRHSDANNEARTASDVFNRQTAKSAACELENLAAIRQILYHWVPSYCAKRPRFIDHPSFCSLPRKRSECVKARHGKQTGSAAAPLRTNAQIGRAHV